MTDAREVLREVLEHTAVALERSDVAFALGGGCAAWALGAPDPEHDVDFVVADPDRARAVRVLEEAGLRVETPPEDWLFEVFHDDAMVDVINRMGGGTGPARAAGAGRRAPSASRSTGRTSPRG